MKRRVVWWIVPAGVAVAVVCGFLLFRSGSGYEAAQRALTRLAAERDFAALAERNIAAQRMVRDKSNALLDIGRRIVGPAGDPDYFCPEAGPLSTFLTSPEAQRNTRAVVAENGEVLRALEAFYDQKGGVQLILSPEELRKFRRSINRIINLCCDRMALAVLERNRERAGRILDESCYFLTVTSQPSSLRELSDFNIALTVWQVHIFGTYVNTFPLTEQEIDALSGQLQTFQGRLSGSFRSALAGECLALFRQFSAGDPRLSWRIDRYDDYFRRLNRLPRDRWSQAERIFQVAERIAGRCRNFREYGSTAAAFRQLEQETEAAAPLVQHFCRPFWTLYRGGAEIGAQFQCDLVKLAVLKFWNQRERLPRNLAELAAVKCPEEALIDPLTGRLLTLEIPPEADRIQVLHGGRNWGRPIRLSRP